eukprot:523060-Rhodomonas_salina.2
MSGSGRALKVRVLRDVECGVCCVENGVLSVECRVSSVECREQEHATTGAYTSRGHLPPSLQRALNSALPAASEQNAPAPSLTKVRALTKVRVTKVGACKASHAYEVLGSNLSHTCRSCASSGARARFLPAQVCGDGGGCDPKHSAPSGEGADAAAACPGSWVGSTSTRLASEKESSSFMLTSTNDEVSDAAIAGSGSGSV